VNISEIKNFEFFKVDKYRYQNSNVCDFSDCPRPHFCMGLLLDGEADFYFWNDGMEKIVHVEKGDIIFVPLTSQYKSLWRGNSDISYISYHFCFAPNCIISERSGFVIQRVEVPDFDRFKRIFEYAYDHYDGSVSERFVVMGDFYRLFGEILPSLLHTNEKKYDSRIKNAVDYIHLNSEQDMSVEQLSSLCNMSVSNFYAKFRDEVGMSPIDYKNHILVNRASSLLICKEDISIEEISSMLGFSSATYFRRLFKKITGKSPSQYRKSALEL